LQSTGPRSLEHEACEHRCEVLAAVDLRHGASRQETGKVLEADGRLPSWLHAEACSPTGDCSRCYACHWGVSCCQMLCSPAPSSCDDGGSGSAPLCSICRPVHSRHLRC